METKLPSLRHALLTLLEPFTKGVGKIIIPHKFKLTAKELAEISAIVVPGDILLSHIDLSASNILIPGFWKHAAMVVSGGRVVEAVGGGVRVVSLADFVLSHDALQVMDPVFANPAEKPLAANFALSLVGMPYDFDVEFSDDRATNKAFYCSEVIWWSYDQVIEAEGRKSPFVPKETLGMQTVVPQDFADAKDKCQVKWTSLAKA